MNVRLYIQKGDQVTFPDGSVSPSEPDGLSAFLRSDVYAVLRHDVGLDSFWEVSFDNDFVEIPEFNVAECNQETLVASIVVHLTQHGFTDRAPRIYIDFGG